MDQNKEKVIVIGGGFGGLEVCKELNKSKKHEVLLIDSRDHHLFQPLLYQVAASGLSPSDISKSLYYEFLNSPNIKFRLGNLITVIPNEKKILLSSGLESYDKLVLACGASTNFFGNPHWEKHTLPLKTIEDAREIKNRIIANTLFSVHSGKSKTQSLQTIIVVGGGPTGVEMAASLKDIYASPGRFKKGKRHLHLNVLLVEKDDRLVVTFKKENSNKIKEYLESIGVKVHLKSKVGHINEKGVLINNTFFKTNCMIWAAGVCAPKINKTLPFSLDNTERLKVDDFLRVIGEKNIYCIGDQACFKDPNGKLLTGLASIAKQQGKHLGKCFRNGKIKKFQYKNWGQMIAIGKKKALIETPYFTLRGLFAWYIWSFLHIFLLIGFRNRILVFLKWTMMFLSFRPGDQAMDKNIEWKRLSRIVQKDTLPSVKESRQKG